MIGSPTMVGQIRVLAILMMVHGALVFAMGLLYLACAAWMPVLMQSSTPSGNTSGPSPAMPPWFFSVYLIMGTPALIAGVMQIFAGWRNYDLRSRTLGIVAAIGGVFASTTCYCAPSGIAMAVYGLVILLNPAVTQGFAWRAEGAAAQDVLARLYQPYVPWQPPAEHADGSPQLSPPATEQPPPGNKPPPREP